MRFMKRKFAQMCISAARNSLRRWCFN